MAAAAAVRRLRVGFVGSGAVNFGGAEGPWDHATRLEALAQRFNLHFVGVADPLTEKAAGVVKKRAAGTRGDLYAECNVYDSHQRMMAEAAPDVVFLGTPPVARGGSSAPVELDLVNGGAHVFAEKPVSLAPPDDVIKYTANLEQAAHSHSDGVRRVVNVGYMFRHSAAVAAARSLIEEEADGRVMAVLARYNSAYAAIDHPFWWDVRQSGGPIVEQATHFVDLARYLGGDVDMGSVSGVSIPATTDIGTLKRVPGVVDEAAIPPEYRLPRVHSATWRFASGAVGTLTHGLLLHGEAYDTGLEVWCDGLRIAFEELYDARKCRIRVRRSGSDDDEVHTFAGDDMYLTQVGAFLTDVEAAREGEPAVGGVLSPFDDAVASYLLSVAIRDKCTAAP